MSAIKSGKRASSTRSIADYAPQAAQDTIEALRNLHNAAAQPHFRAAIYCAALVILSGGLFIALRALPDGLQIEDWKYLLFIFFLAAPLTVLMNTLETELSARILGVSFGWRRALRISILSSAANVLPLPGGPIVRAAALNDLGVNLTKSGGVVVAVAALSLGIVFAYAGFWFCVMKTFWVGGLFTTLGLAAIVLSVAGIRCLGSSMKLVAIVSILKILTSAIGVLGIWWGFAALGVFLSLQEASIFSVAGVAGVAVSFVPAGLGVTETVAAALAALIAVSPAVAFLAAAIFRIVWLVFLLPAAAIVAVTKPETSALNTITNDNAVHSTKNKNLETHAITDRQSRSIKAKKIERIISSFHSIHGAAILDIGAGAGHITEYFADRVGPMGKVAGIDTSNQIRHQSSVDFQLAHGTTIPHPDHSFDIAISNHVIEHVGGPSDQTRHLFEIHRILKADGLLYLAVPNRRTLLEPHYKLFLLSWLPKSLADVYMRAFRKGSHYDCALLSRSDVGNMAASLFDIEDITQQALLIFISHELKGLAKKIAGFAARRFYFLLRPIIPTLIFICRPKANA